MKREFLFTIFFSFFIVFSNWSFSQTSISGIINLYSAVDSIYPTKDTIEVVNPALFNLNDTVMIYQAKGANPVTEAVTNPYNFGSVRNFTDLQEAGKYEIILIQNKIGNQIIFKSILNNDYDTKDLVQLIKVPSFKSASIDGELSCDPWDGSIGGVLALMVSDTLFLNANIDVTGKGFIGAPAFESNGDCASVDSAIYGSQYFKESRDTISAGFKGEGVAEFDTIYRKGLGRWANGGGGGNARFSGGGGGGNDGNGGYGGEEDASSCITPAYETNPDYFGNWNALGGSDGFGLGKQNLINDSTIFLGGGGGSGTYTTGLVATAGGNGGGIVILIAKVIKSNGKSIIADGASVTGIADASGGGGGAGGTIVFDIDNVIGSTTVSTKGGVGGWVAINEQSGPGGGGGGGPVLWNNSEPNVDFTMLSEGGKAGYAENLAPDPNTHKATSGQAGTAKPGYNAPLTGFLFNNITADQQVCKGDIPDLISGTEPRGGNGTFTYQWQYKKNELDLFVDTAVTTRDLQPVALNDTTYYQRIVSSGGIDDYGNIVKIIVHDYLSGNNIIGDDLITCIGNEADTITGTELEVGDGGDNDLYHYIWESSIDLNTWSTITEIDDTLCLPGTVLDTTYVRRVVISGACYDTTANIEIIGLPQISNNVLSPDQEICEGQIPDEIIGGDPGNGLGPGTYTIYWEEKTEGSNWDKVTDSTRNDFAPSNLFETMYYRRTVQSDDCFDISDTVKINVLLPIDNDSIVTESLIYTCYNTPPQLIDGSTPINGDATYSYQWQESPDGVSWIDITDSDVEDYQAGALTVKTYFRRLVSSGENGCCTSTSDSIIVDIYPLPVTEIIEDRDTTCSGDDITLDFRIRFGKIPYTLIYSDGYNEFPISNINDTISNPLIYPETDLKSKQFDYTIVSVTDANTCDAADTDISGTHTVIVNGIPTTFSGDDDEACQLTYQFSAIPSSIATGIWTQYSGAGTSDFVPETSATANLTVSIADKYTYIWKETNWNCTNSDTVDITLYERPHHINLSTEDTILYFVDEMNLKGGLINPDTFDVVTTWEFLEGSGNITPSINDSIITFSDLNDLGNPKILYTWTVEKGVCEDTIAQGTIGLKELFTPTGFTPNGDGVNDYLKFNGIENSDENKLIIYNRWGTEVYSQRNYSNDMGWDGKNIKGNDLPEDTYYYVLTVTDDGVSQTHKGFIVIKRF